MTVYKDRASSQWDVAYDFAGRIRTVTAPSVKLHTGSSARPADSISSLESSLMDATSSLASPGANRTAAHFKVRVADPEGHETIYRELSPFGQPGKIEMERGRVARVLYNSDGKVTREVAPTGDSVSYVWSGDRMTQQTLHATGQVINYQYTTYDELSRTWGTGLPDVRHYYFSNGTRDSTTINGATVFDYAWDSKGRVTTVTDADGYQRQYTYGTGFQNVESETKGGQTTNYRYDSYGRLLHVINALNDTVTYSYDDINRVTSIEDEANNTTAFGYSSMYPTSVTDPLSQVYRNYPNALGWDTTVVDPGNRKETYGYDRDGAVRSYTNRRSSTVTYVYNDAHEMTSMTADGQTTNYSVSVDMLTRTASNAASTDTVKIAPAGHVLEEITRRSGQRFSIEWWYDNQLRPTYLQVKKNLATQNWVDYNYDASGRLSSVDAGNAGTTTIGYDPRFNAETFAWSKTPGDTLKLRYPSYGSSGKFFYTDNTIQDYAGVYYAHDALKRTSERWRGDLAEWDEFERNPVGMLTQVQTWRDNNPGGVQCTFDADGGEICEESTDTTLLATKSYSWDAVGNPAGETVTDGRLTTLGSMTLTYDDDGNLTYRTGGGETVEYWWNSLSQLDSANSSVHGKVRYKYDGFGRRVYMNDATGTTQFLWEGDDVVADIDGSGNATRYYNYYPGTSNLHSLRIGTSGYLYLKDGSGNVVGLQNSSGTLVNQYGYSPFGDSVSVSESVANRFRFASGEQDRLGLYYFRARYYDPDLKRFLSEDPIGLAGGINPYVYAANNPIDLVDRKGLCPEGNFDDPEHLEENPCILEGITVTVTADKEPEEDDSGGDPWEPGGHPIAGSGPIAGGGSGTADGGSTGSTLKCIGAAGGLLARFTLDVTLGYAYWSGLATLGSGAVLIAEGYGISTGLILTATVRVAQGTGAPHRAAGRYLALNGFGQLAGRGAGLSSPGLSLFPGRNTYLYLRDGGLSACAK